MDLIGFGYAALVTFGSIWDISGEVRPNQIFHQKDLVGGCAGII